VPSITETSKNKAFFDCVATLMTANLQSLCLNSLDDYTELYVPLRTSTRSYEHSGFIQRLILVDTEIKYEPSFDDFEVSMISMVDTIVKSCNIIQRVETKLYSDSAAQVSFHYFFLF
jgi:dynein heavy chain, axonemal